MATTTICVYILQLEHGKYFVGGSKDPVKAMEEHREGLGGLWTQVHKPVRIIEQHPFQTEADVDNYTKLTMRKYGMENVRGGSWSDVRLTDASRHHLHKEFHDHSGECIIA